jgi:hypothetical protein
METTSLEDWKSLIKKYIKDASIEDYHHEVVDGLLYNAFSHVDNTPYVKGQILHSETTKLGIEVDQGSNSSLIKALEYGAQALNCHINKETNIKSLLNDVNLNYIRSSFIISEDDQQLNLINYLDENYESSPIEYIITNRNNFESKGVKKHYIHLQTDEDNGINALVALCLKVKKTDEPICLELNLSNKFFFEIARIRALYILIANIRGNNAYHNIKIIANLPQIDSKDELIQLTVSTLSAYLGGATIVNAGTINKDLKELTRLQINIQNVLQLESKLNLHNDPMAGSYFMEDLTHKICESVWSKL